MKFSLKSRFRVLNVLSAFQHCKFVVEHFRGKVRVGVDQYILYNLFLLRSWQILVVLIASPSGSAHVYA